jgi:hypothetical protein
MIVPPGIAAAFEVIEAPFALEIAILHLDLQWAARDAPASLATWSAPIVEIILPSSYGDGRRHTYLATVQLASAIILLTHLE